jgi:DNA replication protein DnaC
VLDHEPWLDHLPGRKDMINVDDWAEIRRLYFAERLGIKTIATELVETLYRAIADNSVGKVITQILRADLILIDEIGFAPMDPTGAELFFRLVAAAYERRSLGIGSHWPFEEWGKFLPEHTTAVSLLDRLLHHSVVVVTDGESFRMKEARQKGDRSTLAKT